MRRNNPADRSARQHILFTVAIALIGICPTDPAQAGQLLAGAAKVDITNPDAKPVHDPLFVKALVLKNDTTTAALVTVDAVAIAEIGAIKSSYLAEVRAQLQQELNIAPTNVLINASHCHGAVCADIAQRTVQAVKEACAKMVPVTAGAGVGHEDRIMENRRLKLKDGRQADVRHAYALPPDEQVAEVGPVDPEIGILRLDRENGQTLAVVYNFACHPIQGVPDGGNTADITGFASRVIEDSFGDGAMAFFLQGCAGDVNPVLYKDVGHPRDAEPLGNLLGLSTMRAAKQLRPKDRGPLTVIHETIELPRADWSERIRALQTEQERLLHSLRGTSLNLQTFLPLVMKYGVSGEFPSYYSHRYLHDRQLGRDDFERLDAENRRNLEQYRNNIYIMEELTRVQVNLDLLKKHHAANAASGQKTIAVEMVGLRIGAFVLVTFPGELSVQIGLNVKQASPHELTFVAAYSNGYIYYAPTTEQLQNAGAAQEDCDCLLAPPWQPLFEAQAAELLRKL